MLKLRALITAIALVLAVSVTSMAQEQTIVEIAAGNPDFSTLVELVTAAGLVETLSGEGPFTVFAPTNEAFAAIPPFVVEYLLANPEVLSAVLTYHVLPGKVLSADVTDMMAATVNGDSITVTTDMGVMLDGVATVITADIEASNGVIHVIDAVILPEITLPEVDALSVSDNVIAAGSSTVFPVTERMADLFNQDGFAGTITVDSIGSGAGLERFCVAAETDIANASRGIRDTEIEACTGNGRSVVEFYIGIDALAVVVSTANDFVTDLTLEELAAIFGGTAVTWADVRAEWPAENILKFSPGTDSGTYDFFVEEVLDDNAEGILNAADIQFSEDDNVLVQGVEGSPYAIGFFGYAYFVENAEALKAISLDGIEPNAANAESGEYPLSRPLYIYSAVEILAEKPQVASFISYYLSNVNSQLGTTDGQIGYFPVSKYSMSVNRVVLAALTAGN